MSNNLVKAAMGEAITEGAQAVDFDGTNDYLSRASDFVGNSDSKTFTFSCWLYLNEDGVVYYLYDTTGGSFLVRYSGTTSTLFIIGENSSGATILNCNIANALSVNSFNHILISVDLTNTSNRYLYINDRLVSPTWTTYTDDEIDFTVNDHSIGSRATAANFLEGRLSHVFLDYMYRYLPVESNRRLFITEDLKPAPISTLQALNAIMYFPLIDEVNLITNLGIGGNMVQNGVIVQSQRGPNQDNCVASEFDGVSDGMTSSIVGASDSKVFTASFTVNRLASSTNVVLGSGTSILYLGLFANSNLFAITARNTSGDIILNVLGGSSQLNKNDHISMRINLADPGDRQVMINNIDVTSELTFSVYTDDLIRLTDTFSIATTPNLSAFYNLSIGELYFDTTYEPDLSIFWDSDANRPKPIRQVLDETGNTPLIAMPIRADKPGLNLTGPDFTKVSAPFVGARGMSEFWARSVVVDNTNYLTYSSVLCASLIKAVSTDSGATWTISFLNNVTVTDIGNGTDNGMVGFYFGTSEVITWDEENKLRFVDALGYPIDIETDSNTLIYHKFDDPTAFNENLGSAGNPTETGTITQGADVDP